MPIPSPPINWEADEVTRFFDVARTNEYATFSNFQPEVIRFLDIDKQYRKVVDALNFSKDWFAGFFVLRAHSNLLAAARLAWSGQIPECYALLRSCMENALYGLYLANNPNSRETWLRRHDSEDHKKKLRQEFKISSMLDLLKTFNKKEGEVAELLYERTIDCGAHPNELGLMQTLQTYEKSGNV